MTDRIAMYSIIFYWDTDAGAASKEKDTDRHTATVPPRKVK